MKFEDLTPEQQKKALACKTPEELIQLAKVEGYPLSDDELNAIAGGTGPWCATDTRKCDNYCDMLGPCLDYIKEA